MKIGLEAAQRGLSTFLPLPSGYSRVMGVLASPGAFFITEFTDI